MAEDPLLPDVLLFPAGADLHAHPLVQSHCLVLQVRAGRALSPKHCSCSGGVNPGREPWGSALLKGRRISERTAPKEHAPACI